MPLSLCVALTNSTVCINLCTFGLFGFQQRSQHSLGRIYIIKLYSEFWLMQQIKFFFDLGIVVQYI